jgi:hypothetical protein
MKRFVAITAVVIPIILVAVVFAVRGQNDAHSAGAVPTVEALTDAPEETPGTQPPAEAAVPPADASGGAEGNGASEVRVPVTLIPGIDSIWSPFTRAELDRLQAAVDQGHQPWRLDPVSVAEAYLRDRIEVEPVMGAYRPLDAFSGEVPYRGKPLPTEGGCGCPRLVDSEYLQGHVLLRRLGGSGSVFFVVGQRSPEVSVTSSVTSQTVTLHVRTDLVGEVYAVAGPLRSEATAHDHARVVAGQRVTLTLKLGARQFPLLVQIIHSGVGLPARLTEFRLGPAS